MLKEHGLKATFYVAPENQEFAKDDLLSLPEIRNLSQDFEIGAHSMTHRRLPTISEQEAAREIIESSRTLASRGPRVGSVTQRCRARLSRKTVVPR